MDDRDYIEEPLKSSEGSELRNGRHIIPTGEAYKTTAHLIHEMTDEQLSAHIQELKAKVHAAERETEYYRINLSSATMEQEERVFHKRRKAVREQILIKLSSGQVINANQLEERRKKPRASTGAGATLISQLKAKGFNDQQIKDFIAEMEQIAKNANIQ